MREILFRGKRIDNGEWVEGTGFLCDGNTCWVFGMLGQCGIWFDDWVKVDPATVGQYTGLTDKNGERIFEGDVFRQELPPDDDEEQPFVARSLVVFDEVGFAESCIGKRGLGAPLYLGEYCDLDAEASAWEVIGNIHDNPELLEGGDS
jgi:uncharacterized phage protein (TIGR01671 family)